MASSLNRYSQWVFWLKIILPIVALAILSTLFLFARKVEFDGSLPYAEVEIKDLANDPRLTAPEYAGITDDGVAIRVAAKTVKAGADGSGLMSGEEVVAQYEGTNGGKITLNARVGTLDQVKALLTLTGDVVVNTSDGYRLSSDEMVSSLSVTDLVADGAVRATAPFGTIDAGAMQLTGTEGNHQLVFKKGVRLVYKP